MLVAICAITYQRPEGLKRLLEGINKLNFKKCETPNIEVIIVENESAGAAEAICESIKSEFKWPLKFDIEPERGISYARNKALSCVSKEADFVAFIDDDEVPDLFWLDELLGVQQIGDADVVSGPALPYFKDADIPDWVTKGKFFEPQRYTTGSPLKVTYTNNVLIRSQVLKQMGKIFDERFALTGGEDSYFFTRVYQAGYKLVWADEALVYEWIPKSRTNVKWILMRGYRSWITYSLCEREFERSLKVRIIAIVKAIGRIILGLLLIIPSLFAGRYALIRALLHVSRGAGRIVGLTGRNYQEYKTIHRV